MQVKGWRVPVVALTGHLGAGKTTVLNQLLLNPGARIGVVVNDFGAINVDAGLLTGQVSTAESIAGGCLCCLPDSGGLDEALEVLTRPRLRLDAVVVEASGVAEPAALGRLIRFSGAEHVRPGGLVDVVDADAYFATVDTGGDPPARFGATTLVVINKTDLLPADEREPTVERIRARVHERNPHAHVVVTTRGRVDPALVFDAATDHDPDDQLPLADLAREHAGPPHRHANAVTVPATGPVDPGALIDLLEDPPAGVYRLKGTVVVDTGRTTRAYTANVVGRHIHIAPHPATTGDGLVAIGTHLNHADVHRRLQTALAAPSGPVAAQAMRRLVRYRRLSE
ncbi:CobW family GTP-binding protein [Cellulomonas bogoriensis]|uniref:Cobalamin biosynthesis protein CobW n=1 Tax=Cellulomonas bogoriensis 69B4 = DSM 16987 TaxID=1386082 RepID=A0A0A0C1A5_9CELL|nr:CobW family GTP-binding protein [Cellulomonas bogoriensis]KGM13975.1 cobalamin biosynthesis protein CobW [Cellulomonas bogoriensis 69B4 = DSM 16987]